MKTIFLFIISLSYIQLNSSAKIQVFSDKSELINEVENNLCTKISDANRWSINDRMLYYGINAISIAVIDNFELSWAKAYGYADYTNKTLANEETLFQVGSISKSLNALAILKYFQDNNLNLQEDINNYLKTWKFPYDSISKGKKISLANLLSHTAGLSVHGFNGYNINAKLPKLDQILDGMSPANSPPVRSIQPPGVSYVYSGGGTEISQLLFENLIKTTYHIYMQDSILIPLNMISSSYEQPPNKLKLKNFATGYNKNIEVDGKYHVYPEQAAAGLWTTPKELSVFLLDLLLAYNNKPAKLINNNIAKLMLTPYIDKNAGLGTFITDVSGYKYFYHGGSNEGFIAYYIGGLKDGTGLVMCLNTSNSNSSILTEILNSVAYVYKWKGFISQTEADDAEIDNSLLRGNDEKLIEENIIFINNNELSFCFNDKLNPAFTGATYSIFSVYGDLTLSGIYHSSINFSGLASGTYFLKIQNKFYKIFKF